MVHWSLLCTILLTLANSVLSEWVYPELSAEEGPMTESKVYLNQIESDSTNVASYGLSGEGSDKFEINEDGKIYQVEPLDRETKDKYVITASVYDSFGNKVDDDNEITIKVTDINDNYPQFLASSLSGQVAEAATASDGPFMTVSATDADDPAKFFSRVVYYIEDGTDRPEYSGSGNRFTITESGQVSVNGALDYETDPIVYFLVIAEDGGGQIPGLKTTGTVTVSLLDSNDHAPVFDSSTMPATKYLSELSALDTPLYDIYASDVDVGVNKMVFFAIESGNTGGTFKIESFPSQTGRSKGSIELQEPLDFESGIVQYTLTIRASNKNAGNYADVNYQTTSVLTIKVTDANEAPVFINTPYTATISEADDDPSEPEPISVIVTAEDYDFNSNQTVEYSMNDPEGWFQVDSSTGQISRIAKVDREASAVKNGVYTLKVGATDNYDHGKPGSGNADISITITDINDNPPTPDWGTKGSVVKICSEPVNDTVYTLVATDPDSAVNGPPFVYRLDSSVDSSKWGMRYVSTVSSEVWAKFDDFGLSGGFEEVLIPFTITDNGSPLQTGTATLTVSVCQCNDDNQPTCQDAVAAGFPVVIIIAIIAVLLLIIILIFALVAYKRRQASLELKEPFFDDEDDVRETVQVYQEEGGEEDQDAYDLSALRAPLMEDPNQPVRIEKPLQQAPRAPRGGHIPDDIGDYIGDAKDQADADPSAPPFDSLLVFDYEGQGSDAGSLSSINTATTDGSMDYDYLNNWGPRFKRLADMYNDGSESE